MIWCVSFYVEKIHNVAYNSKKKEGGYIMDEKITCRIGNTALKCKHEEFDFFIFSLPRGEEICIEATDICKKICYTKKSDSFKNVRPSREKNYRISKGDEFVNQVQDFIDKKKKKKITYFRIHEEGDFYNEDYLKKWVEITDKYRDDKSIKFVAYTKSINLLDKFCKSNQIRLDQINIKFIYSQMPDTCRYSLELAYEYKLQKYIVVNSLDEIPDGIEICSMRCNKCMSCYTKNEDNYSLIR